MIADLTDAAGWVEGWQWMAKIYRKDSRGGVVAAVEGGMSRRAAAGRFKAGAATAIAWLRTWRDGGGSITRPRSGDARSHRIEACHGVILAAV